MKRLVKIFVSLFKNQDEWLDEFIRLEYGNRRFRNERCYLRTEVMQNFTFK